MGIFDCVKKGFGVAAKNIGLVLVLIVFNLIWNLASIPLAQQATPTPEITAIALILGVAFILISIFIQGGSMGLVRDYVKEGRMKLSDITRYGLKYYLRLLGMGLLIILVIAVIGLVAALVVAATVPLNNTAVTVTAAVLALTIGGVGLYGIFLLILAPYALVCDELGVVESLKASIAKVRRSLLKVLLLLVVVILISLGIGFLVGFLAGIATVALPVGAAQVVIGVVNSVFNGYLGVVMMAAFMAFYLAITAGEGSAAEKIF